jgi:hypothetical protein
MDQIISSPVAAYTGPVVAGLRPDTGRLYLLIAPHPAVDRLMDALAVRLALAAHAAGVWSAAGGNRAGEGNRRSADAGDLTETDRPEPYLYLLDGGNRFSPHGIARGIAAGGIAAGGIAAGGSLQVEAILQRITVARAFTCYQVEALLADIQVHCTFERTEFASAMHLLHPSLPLHAPILAPGLLTTFADENVPPGERQRLLLRCIQHLKRLAQDAPVLVGAAPLQPAGCRSATGLASGASATDTNTATKGAGLAPLMARLEAAADQVWRFETDQDPKGLKRPLGSAGGSAPDQLRLF